MSAEHEIQVFRGTYAALKAEIGKVLVGQEEAVDQTLQALFAGGMYYWKVFRAWERHCWCGRWVRFWT